VADYARAAQQEREEAAAKAEADARTRDRLQQRLLELAAQAPSELPRDPHVPDWIDQYDPRSVRNGELFEQDIAECKSTKVGKYQLTDVEDAVAAQVVSR